MDSFGSGTTTGSMAISPGGPLDHVACFAEIARWRERAEAAEGKLAEIEAYARAWAESAAATEWSGTVLSTTVLADAGRTILAITGTEGERRD